MRSAGWAGWRVAAPLLMATSCAPVGPPEVTLATLVSQGDAYEGVSVTTHGTVVELIGDPGDDASYAVRDDFDNMVRLVPSGWALPYRDKPVSVTGLFRGLPDSGSELVVQHIDPPP